MFHLSKSNLDLCCFILVFIFYYRIHPKHLSIYTSPVRIWFVMEFVFQNKLPPYFERKAGVIEGDERFTEVSV